MALLELKAKISADASGMQREVGRAEQLADKFAANTEKKLGRMFNKTFSLVGIFHLLRGAIEKVSKATDDFLEKSDDALKSEGFSKAAREQIKLWKAVDESRKSAGSKIIDSAIFKFKSFIDWLHPSNKEEQFRAGMDSRMKSIQDDQVKSEATKLKIREEYKNQARSAMTEEEKINDILKERNALWKDFVAKRGSERADIGLKIAKLDAELNKPKDHTETMNKIMGDSLFKIGGFIGMADLGARMNSGQQSALYHLKNIDENTRKKLLEQRPYGL